MNLIDKFAEVISPKWALSRQAARSALMAYRNYDAAKTDRLNSNWSPTATNGEQTDSPYRNLIRDRARDLERNNPFAESIVSALERNVVGTGFRMQALVMKSKGVFDDALNDEIEEKFEEWCRARNCDITGQSTFAELLAMALRRMVVDGDTLALKVYDTTATIPFKIQMMEPDLLDTGRVRTENDNVISSGIELNRYNAPLAYYFFNQTLDGFQSLKSERYKAQQVIHLFRKTRPTQIRGVSLLARVMQNIRDIGEFVEADIVSARIAACFAAFVETADGMGRQSKLATNTSGQKIDSIEPGMFEYLAPGEKISFAQPGMQAGNSKDFVQLQQRVIGSGVGMSYEVISRDVSQVNFSSARQGHLEDRKTFIPLQKFLIEHFCREVYTEFLISAVLKGEIDIPDFWQNKAKYLKHAWITPGWAWIDPVKEVDAATKGLAAGLNTYADELASQGKDYQEVFQQCARERELAKSLGLTLNIDGKGGTANAQQNTDESADDSGDSNQSGKGKN